MAAYNDRLIASLNTPLRECAQKLYRTEPLVISSKEFASLFIEAEHLPILKQTRELCGDIGSNYGTATQIGDADVRLHFDGGSKNLIPEYCLKGFAKSAPPELVAKFTAWVDKRVEMGKAFGDAWDALRWLNYQCGSSATLAVMFPALPTLMGMIDSNPDSAPAKRAQRLASVSRFGTLVSLPREVRDRIAEVCNLITASTLLENTVAEPKMKTGDAQVSVVSFKRTEPNFIDASLRATFI